MIKLMQGDCLELMKQIPDGSVDMILQDPPYNTTACKWEWDIMTKIDEFWAEWKRIIKPNGAIVMTASQPFTTRLIASNYKDFKYCWVWEKTSSSNPQHANYQPLKVHEDITIFTQGGTAAGSKKPCTYNKQYDAGEPYYRGFTKSGKRCTSKGFNGVICNNESGNRSPRSVIKISNPKGKNILVPTQKPVPLMEYLIKTYTNEGETVFDGFVGSGTTGVACRNTGRKFIGIELDQHYFEIAKNRIEAAA